MEGLKLIAACVAEQAPQILLKLVPDVLVGEQELAAYNYVMDHWRQYTQLPQLPTIRENTGIRFPSINENSAYYERAVYNRFASNSARRHYEDLRNAITDTTDQGIQRGIESAFNMLQAFRLAAPQDHMFGANQLGAQVMDRLRRAELSSQDFAGITTGWGGLDRILDGYQDADVVTIVARMGMGKTYLLLHQALAAEASGRRVMFVTTEMGPEQIGRRIVAMGTGLNPQTLRRGQIATQVKRRIQAYFQELNLRDRLRVVSVGFNSTVAQIDAMVEEWRPDILYVDGTYLLKPSAKGMMSRTEKVAHVFDELKVTAMVRNIPVVNTTQFNRNAGKGGKEGSLENIAMSDVIAQNSSVVLGVRFGNTVDPKQSRVIDVMKDREGGGGEIEIGFGFAPINFTEIDADRSNEQDSDEGLGW